MLSSDSFQPVSAPGAAGSREAEADGPVVITGDLALFHENYESNGVPPFNTGRAETLASLDRVKKIVANLKATVIIQHDGRDIAKLPALPASAR